MTKDEFYMGKAIEEAKIAAAVGEIPVGAVVIYQKKAIARAYNLRETLPCATAHAELLAIEKACRVLGRWRLTGCTLYVTVEPCPMCAAALRWAQLGTLVYGAPDPKRGYTTLSPQLLHPKTIVISGPLSAECAQLVSSFFAELRVAQKTRFGHSD